MNFEGMNTTSKILLKSHYQESARWRCRFNELCVFLGSGWAYTL